jgi:putative DNA primase/helicase
VLERLGMPASFLSGKHSPCPVCGGKDRFRFLDTHGEGTFVCTQCKGGNGFTLLMRWKNVDFLGALDLLRPLVNSVPARIPPRSDWTRGRREISSPGENQQRAELWSKGLPVAADDPVGKYLIGRCSFVPKTTELRTIVADDGAIMVARFRAPDNSSATLHLTYLDQSGQKIKRLLAPGPIPKGGAVRLMPMDEGKILGIAEGIETALSASVLFNVPVWSALNAGGVSSWQWPADIREIMIFADNDQNMTGQKFAETLRMCCEAQTVKATVHVPETTGTDWNDVHQQKEFYRDKKECD